MFCSKCGTETPNDAQFCHRCGKPLPVDSSRPKASEALEIDYELLSDEPKPYFAPASIQLNFTKRQIVEAGRATDKVVTDNLKLLFERTVCQGKTPKLLFVDGTSNEEKLSIERAFDPNRSDFVSTLATCCTAMLLGRTTELSPKKWMFVELFRGLVDEKIRKLGMQFPELPSVLSHAAFAACYARYLEHGGKIGLLSTPYLGYIRSLNRSVVSEAYKFRNEIEVKYNGKNDILSMLAGLEANNFFVPILIIQMFLRFFRWSSTGSLGTFPSAAPRAELERSVRDLWLGRTPGRILVERAELRRGARQVFSGLRRGRGRQEQAA